ncbi:hypothetical protein [Nocardioides sp. zg-1228]|uniref:hypothetical protein n=1 Tax=Nocardioides sp. zg-1228 TaxID=2763008 RepID=UPI001642755D|nr:hypothetical protein [Nocardioides sp. zg-1228]MBC2933403.1 hypothetical protein [Nocardioides sp. zg-1228]QSF56446.1 hypothetical protein JX575_12410 [Nocardioides sp. zg-1228]
MTDGDAALLGRLREMWTTCDPPPPGLTETMIAAVAAADLDDEWELLVLVRDSREEPAAEVRGVTTSRILYFTAAEGWSLDAEVEEGQVRGQLLDFDGDMGSVEVVVEAEDGQRWTTGLDDVGFFVLAAAPTGAVRFTLGDGHRSATSRWIDL